ncbi:MAG: hypothetical protein Q8K69_02945 [Bacteroidota bacterium]|nr:hypothetical protein [Bacteroidota bacterium]
MERKIQHMPMNKTLNFNRSELSSGDETLNSKRGKLSSGDETLNFNRGELSSGDETLILDLTGFRNLSGLKNLASFHKVVNPFRDKSSPNCLPFHWFC